MNDMLAYSLGAFFGAIGFGYLQCAPRRTILPSALISLAGYAAFCALYRYLGRGMLASYFLSTAIISVLCELEARRMRVPATVFMLCALVPLVPGVDFYNAMLALVNNDGGEAASAMMRAVQIVAAIAVGAAASSACVRAAFGRRSSLCGKRVRPRKPPAPARSRNDRR